MQVSQFQLRITTPHSLSIKLCIVIMIKLLTNHKMGLKPDKWWYNSKRPVNLNGPKDPQISGTSWSVKLNWTSRSAMSI